MKTYSPLASAFIVSALLTMTACRSPMCELQQGSQEPYPQKTVKANFGKVMAGMGETDVRKLLGYPTGSKFYQTGKAWVPFYFGQNTRRVEDAYGAMGYVTFSRNAYSDRLNVVTTRSR